MTALLLVASGVALLLAALAAYTRVRVRAVERRHPRQGGIVSLPNGSALDVVRLPATDDREGRVPLVFVHGTLTNLMDMRTALEAPFAGRRPLVFLDRPGLGWSGPRRPGQSKPAPQAVAIGEALDRLDVPPAIVVAHSYGAAVALALALHRPDRVAGLALLAPASHPWPGGVKRRYRLLASPLLGWLLGETVLVPIGDATLENGVAGSFAPAAPPPRYAEATGLGLNYRPRDGRNNARDIVDLEAAVAAMAPRYPEIAVPAVVVTADEDAVVWPSIHAAGLIRDLPDAALVEVPGAGHNVHHTATAAVVDAIEALAARIEEAAPPTPREASGAKVPMAGS